MAGIAPKYYYLTLGLIAFVTLVGMTVAFRLQREVAEDAGPTTPKELFGPLENAYYSGLMDEAEFLRIQESMRKVQGDAGPPPAPTRKPKPRPDPANEDF